MALVAAARAAVLAAALASPAPARAADPLAPWSGHIAEAAARFGVPATWIRRVMAAESGGRTHWNGRPIVSSAGAMGLMQLMPGTWRQLRGELGLGHDPHQPRDNILAGGAYLRRMYDRFGYPGLFAAYNAGPARYARHLATGRPLPAETRSYVLKVSGRAPLGRPAVLPGRAALPAALKPVPALVPSLFAWRAGGGDASPGSAANSPETDRLESGLFVALRGTASR